MFTVEEARYLLRLADREWRDWDRRRVASTSHEGYSEAFGRQVMLTELMVKLRSAVDDAV